MCLGLVSLIIPVSCYSQDSLAAKYGWLQFKSNVDSLFVVMDNNFSTSIPVANRDSIRFKAGVYNFTFVNPKYWDEKMQIQVPDSGRLHFLVIFHHKIRKDFNRSSYKRITEGLTYNLALSTDPNSTIIIDDSTYGKRFVKTDVGPYYHNIIIKHPTAMDQKKRIYIEPSEQLNLSIYDRPARATAYTFGLVPGLSQLYKNQKLKGAIFITATTGALALSIGMAAKFKSDKKDYNYLHGVYEGDVDEQSAYLDGLAAEHKYKSMKTASRIRDLALTSLVGIYVANVIDALVSVPQSGYRVKLGVGPGMANHHTSMNVNMEVRF